MSAAAVWLLLACTHDPSCDVSPASAPDPDDLASVAAMIDASSRPMILAGHGVMISGAEKELAALAEKAGIPVAATLLGLSSIPSDHPLYKGMLGMHGNIGPNMATNKADLIIGIGMRFDDRVTGIASAYAPDARIIHIDIDASEFDKVVPAAIALHGDASKAIEALLSLIEPVENRSSWLSLFDKCMECEGCLGCFYTIGYVGECTHLPWYV